MAGWFALKHGIVDHPIFKRRPDRLAIWVWLLDKAAYAETRQDVMGKTVIVPRGHVLVAERVLAKEVGVGYQTVRTLMDRLKRDNMISVETNAGRSLIKLINFERYQSAMGLTNASLTQDQRTKEQGNNTLPDKSLSMSTLPSATKAAPREAKPKIEAKRFEEFWSVYPHRGGTKRGKKPSLDEYLKAMKAGIDEETIIQGALKAHHDPMVAKGSARDPRTWLHNAGWDDEIATAKIIEHPASRKTPNAQPDRYARARERAAARDALVAPGPGGGADVPLLPARGK